MLLLISNIGFEWIRSNNWFSHFYGNTWHFQRLLFTDKIFPIRHKIDEKCQWALPIFGWKMPFATSNENIHLVVNIQNTQFERFQKKSWAALSSLYRISGKIPIFKHFSTESTLGAEFRITIKCIFMVLCE